MYPIITRKINIITENNNGNDNGNDNNNDITPTSKHSTTNNLKQYNIDIKPSIHNSKSMKFTSLKEQTHKPRSKKHNHIMTNKTALPHHKKKLFIQRKNFFLPL